MAFVWNRLLVPKVLTFTASMIFAVYWALWHAPLSSINGYYHSNLVAEGIIYSLNFVVSLLPFVVLMNWLYYKSGRNILVTVIFHLTANTFNKLFATHPDSKVIQTILLVFVALYVLSSDKEMFFGRKQPLTLAARQSS
jgi:hypothetical protein